MQFPADILATTLYHSYPDPVLAVNAAWHVVAANPAAMTLLGYAEHELLGMDAAVLEVPPNQRSACEAAVTADEPSMWRRRMARLRRKDGHVLDVELDWTTLPGTAAASAATLLVVREIVPLGLSLGEGPVSADPLRSALESISVGFAIYDDTDRLVLSNSAYRNLHAAFTPAIETGKTFEAILREGLASGQYPEAGATAELREAWIAQRLERHNHPGEPYVQQISADRWIKIEDRITAGNYRVGLRTDVTDLTRAKSEAERLGSILEGVAQEVYLFNPKDRTIIYANKSARDNLQYSMEELRGMDVRKLNADMQPDEVSKKLLPLLTGETKVLQIDTRHRRKDGTIYVCRVRMERMVDSLETVLLALGEDITERLEIERALERRRTEFEALVRSLPDLISRAEPDTTLTYVNENYARFVGREPLDMVGRKFMDFIPLDARGAVLEKISGLTPDMPMKTMERQMQDHAGQSYWYSWTNLMVFEDGRPVELVSVGRDVTESYKARERITEQRRELAQRNDALEQFAGIVSHDLKAPLRQIRLFADMIAEDVSFARTDELGMLSAQISDRSKSMEQMISNLLEYSQFAYQTIKPMRFKLSQAVAEAWRNLAVHANEANARLISKADAEIYADFALMIQLLQNLFANSMKYRAADAEVTIRVDVDCDDTVFVIAVTDSGIGIDPAQADKIFGAFQRLHRDERQYAGTGLGLSLCRKIAESHGGAIHLDVSYQQGARFVVTLPKIGL